MEAHIQKANELITLFQSQGNALYFGEHVTQLQHAIQCALIASSEGSDAETILAAFLHDIGHLHPDGALVETMDQYGVADHEQLGAEYLREMGFSEKVCTLVRSHVAKSENSADEDLTDIRNLMIEHLSTNATKR